MVIHNLFGEILVGIFLTIEGRTSENFLQDIILPKTSNPDCRDTVIKL
jgi:hypothetical protein